MKRRWYPKSPPILRVHPLQLLAHNPVNLVHLVSLSAPEHPPPTTRRRRPPRQLSQVCPQRRRHEILEALTAQRSRRLRLPEKIRGNLNRRLDVPTFPYLRAQCKALPNAGTDVGARLAQ